MKDYYVFTLTFLALLVLKLTGFITVSYWVVFSPIIIDPIGFGLCYLRVRQIISTKLCRNKRRRL